MTAAQDPEIAAIATICTALESLGSDAERQRVLEFASAKFNLARVAISQKLQSEEEGDEGDAALLARFEHGKPADNVALLTALHYSKYGTQPFSASDLKASADAAGLIVPARIDMTLTVAGKKGKKFYQKLSPGRFRVTVHGESFLKATYGVKKGTQVVAAQPQSPE